MAEESNAAPESQALSQGLVDLRQTWEHLARELASGVPELPGVIDQELSGLNLTDLNEETLIRVTEAVVARVAAAGFPDEAAVLLRRMGRAMYELLLLMATQEEIREMKPPAFAPDASPPQLTVLRPPDEDVLDPFDLLEVELEPEEVPAPLPKPEEVLAPLPEPEPSHDGNGTSADSATAAVPLPQPPAVAQPLRPRDPVRPAAVGIDKNTIPTTDSPAVLEVAALVAPARTPPAVPDTLPAPVVPLEEPSQATTPAASAPMPAQTPPPAQAQTPPPVQAQTPPPAPPAPPPVATRPPAVVAPPAPTPSPTSQPRELTEEDAPLWGFDPATREVEASEPALQDPALEEVEEPAASETVITASAGPAVEERTAPPELAPPEPAPTERQPAAAQAPPPSGWTVRLSPRRATEQEQKLAARELEIPPLIEEILLAAKSQQERLSARGNARRVLAAAKERPAISVTADPATEIKAMLEAGQLEEAATLAVQMALTAPGDDAATVVCAVGEEVRQAKHLELSLLCFTTAVLCAPPCDRACWQLCTLSVERRDAEAAPIWLEFVARLLRARGADLDAISVYRQLLKLAPRRHDIRELLRVSSLTGQLPD